MVFVEYYAQPELRGPVVIAAFAGWNDAADSATTVIKFLIDKWKPTKLAEIEPEEFYVFTETRPIVWRAEKHKLTLPGLLINFYLIVRQS